MLRFFAVLVVLAAIAGGAWFWEQQNWQAAGPSIAYKIVMVKPGDHVATISENLQKNGVIANANLFRIGLRLRNQQTGLKAGEYGFPARVSMADVTAILIAGKSIEHKLTAAEGLTSQMIYDIVKKDPVLVGDAGAVPQEGTLLPETYLFTRGMTRVQMLNKMREAQKKLIAAQWPARIGNLPIKTPQEAIILASIVEKETGIPEERRHATRSAVASAKARSTPRRPTTPTPFRVCPSAPSAIRAKTRSWPCSIRQAPTICISLPMEPGAMCSPRPWRNTKRTSRIGAKFTRRSIKAHPAEV